MISEIPKSKAEIEKEKLQESCTHEHFFVLCSVCKKILGSEKTIEIVHPEETVI